MAPQFLLPSFCRSRNNNTKEPARKIWPRYSEADPEYTLSEAVLRGAICIPDTFTYGKKLPVILCPGTATPAGISYRFNIYRLLAKSEFADPVFLNIPGTTVGDIQVIAEYFAYAIHYLSATCIDQSKCSVAIIAQSQGCINTQWTLKHWPSTRDVVSSFVAISASFNGSSIYNDRLSQLWRLACPSLLQQMSNSTFVATLRDAEGDSAYVPTTSIYTVDDEIIIPQQGENASARLGDARGVGVTNVEIQVHCPSTTKAGQRVSHVAVIYHSLTWALITDALTHGGSADMERIDLTAVHELQHAPGTSPLDIALTRVGDVISLVYIFKYWPKRRHEPPIAMYAAKSRSD